MSRLKTPLHPGAVLAELYLSELSLSPIGLARALGVPRTRIERLVKGQTSMTPDTALRLARAFGTTPEYWMTMQVNFDLSQAREVEGLEDIKPLVA